MCIHDACALQMRKHKKTEAQQAAAKKAREAAAEALRHRNSIAYAAPVDSGTDPPPAGRFRRS